MNFNSLELFQILFAFSEFIVTAMLITASALLLKERSAGPILMLTGSILTILGSVARIAWSFLGSGNPIDSFIKYHTVISGGKSLGMILFAIGLLLHVLRRRALMNRIIELETVVSARDSDHR